MAKRRPKTPARKRGSGPSPTPGRPPGKRAAAKGTTKREGGTSRGAAKKGPPRAASKKGERAARDFRPARRGPAVEGEMRLQKFLAACGLGSRRACEELIEAGRVSVDGELAELGSRVSPATQKVTFDGEVLRLQSRRYFVLNKPTGVLCTNNDPAGRRRVIDLFPSDSPRMFPVGRLDEDSEGLLVVTNDGDFAHLMAHPRHRIYRSYRVQVAGDPPRETLEQLKKGFYFADGKFKVHGVEALKRQGKSTFLELTLTEGQNREIRRLMARIGHKVLTLQRVQFGPIRLGKLKPGEYRELTRDEIDRLEALVQRNTAES